MNGAGRRVLKSGLMNLVAVVVTVWSRVTGKFEVCLVDAGGLNAPKHAKNIQDQMVEIDRMKSTPRSTPFL